MRCVKLSFGTNINLSDVLNMKNVTYICTLDKIN